MKSGRKHVARPNNVPKSDRQFSIQTAFQRLIEFCVCNIFLLRTSQVVENLKLGNESLKKLNSLMSVEEVERIMDETREAVEYQAEVDSLLSGAGLTREDEEAVQAELEALTGLDEEQLPAVPDTEIPLPESIDQETELPDVPVAEPGNFSMYLVSAIELPADSLV